MTQEVIALLLPDTEAGPARGTRPAPQALIRREDGAVVLEDVKDASRMEDKAIPRLRESVPIICPMSRDVIGYELRPVTKAS